MTYKKYEKARQKARGRFQRDEISKAEAIISLALSKIGWNYAGLLRARRSKKLIGIEGTHTFWHKLAFAFKVLPNNTVEWAVPGLMLLGEIYEKKGMKETAYTLYDDMQGYMELGLSTDVLPRLVKVRAEVDIRKRHRDIDLEQDNLVPALKNHIAHLLKQIHLTKLENNEIEFAARYPYSADAILVDILGKMERENAKDAVIEIVNRNVNVDMGRVFIDRAERDVNNLIKGRRSFNDKTREATRDILASVIERAIEKDKKEDEEEEEESDTDVILL